jgi:hypothetical protein
MCDKRLLRPPLPFIIPADCLEESTAGCALPRTIPATFLPCLAGRGQVALAD